MPNFTLSLLPFAFYSYVYQRKLTMLSFITSNYILFIVKYRTKFLTPSTACSNFQIKEANEFACINFSILPARHVSFSILSLELLSNYYYLREMGMFLVFINGP